MENPYIASLEVRPLPLPVPSARDILRNDINALADPPAREAVWSNTLSLVVVTLSELVSGLSKVQTVAEIRDAAASFVEVAERVNAAIDKGELRFPYQLKEDGAAAVLNEMTTLANGITDAMRAYKSAE